MWRRADFFNIVVAKLLRRLLDAVKKTLAGWSRLGARPSWTHRKVSACVHGAPTCSGPNTLDLRDGLTPI